MTSVISLPLGDEVKVTHKGDMDTRVWLLILRSTVHTVEETNYVQYCEDRSRVSYTDRVMWDRQGKLIREWLIKSKTIAY